MDQSPKEWLRGYSLSACVLKFIGGIICGLLVVAAIYVFTFFIFLILFNAPFPSFCYLYYFLMSIPIVFGLIGVFNFEFMFDSADKICKRIIGDEADLRKLE